MWGLCSMLDATWYAGTSRPYGIPYKSEASEIAEIARSTANNHPSDDNVRHFVE
jgi:hypothetical protein